MFESKATQFHPLHLLFWRRIISSYIYTVLLRTRFDVRRLLTGNVFFPVPLFGISTPVVHGLSDTVEMEALVELLGTLKAMSKIYQENAGDEFCALVVGLSNLGEASAAYERKELGSEEVMAVGWRVERDLAQFVRSVRDCSFRAAGFLQVRGRPRMLRAVAGPAVSAAQNSCAPGQSFFPTACLNFN